MSTPHFTYFLQGTPGRPGSIGESGADGLPVSIFCFLSTEYRTGRRESCASLRTKPALKLYDCQCEIK